MAQAADPKGYYEVLGVTPSATADEIRYAFRDAAKRYHPDHGGDADNDKFLALTEAYDTLRNGRRRMQYDASRLENAHSAFNQPTSQAHPFRKHEPARAATGAKQPRGEPLKKELKQSRFGAIMGVAAAGLSLALLVTLGFLWTTQQRAAEQETLLQDAYSRISQATQEQSDMRARYRASGFMRLEEALAQSTVERSNSGSAASTGYVFQAELAFPSNSIELRGAMQRQTDDVILGLIDIIEQIPQGRDWLILLEGAAGQAADPEGVAVGAWENALLRLGSITDYMTDQGLPPERLAVRFQAGFKPVGDSASQASIVEVKLMCCFR